MRPNAAGDDLFVQAVLHGDHEPVIGEQRHNRRERSLGMLRLHRQDDESERRLQRIRKAGLDRKGAISADPRDPQPLAVDGVDVLADIVHQQYVMAGGREIDPRGPADGAGADDSDVHLYGFPAAKG